MTPTFKAISDVRCDLGEGPLWHPILQQLYVTDLNRGCVYVLDEALRHKHTIDFHRPTTAMTWQTDGIMLFFHDAGSITRANPWGGERTTLLTLIEENNGLFNDAIADPTGRVLCGTQPIGKRSGRLYCVERDLTYRMLLDDVSEPNGLGFSNDYRLLYFADSEAQVIWRLSYDIGTGAVDDRKSFLRTSGCVLPDGLTVDQDGSLWVALWNRGAVVRVAPDGQVTDTVQVPATRSTSVTFGGPAFGTLFITSAKARDADAGHVECSRVDGAVFAVHGCGRGRPECPSALGPS
jgi:sugar lactone lactonase YvrE